MLPLLTLGFILLAEALFCSALIWAQDPGSDRLGIAASITGERKQWHDIALSFEGPSSSETASPNPFLDYRLDVTFTHALSGLTVLVPGYFAADGDAASTGAASGNIWRAHLAPPLSGEWAYEASFREGSEVAVADSATAGRSARYFDGARGVFSVSSSDKSGLDFRAADRGLLKNRDQHYLSFSNGEPWMKAGVNIPENFMGYVGFDNTPRTGRTFASHAAHWNVGDPNWDSPNLEGSNDGHGIVGALNYIADQGSNSIYFVSMNVDGDTNDTFPTVGRYEKVHYDISKMDQWDIVFSHANKLGIYLHVILGETENPNENYHDGGTLGPQRKLYYRMMVARFGHQLGLEWGIGEESDFGDAKHLEFAGFIKSIDAYDHPISVETRGNKYHRQYDALLGSELFDNTALQGGPTRKRMAGVIEEWRRLSEQSGVPWVVNYQEPQGIQDDKNDPINGYIRGRRDMMWPAFMSGAAGFEWYVQEDGGVTGARDPETGKMIGHRLDHNLNDFSKMDVALQWNGHALSFFGQLPVLEMDALHSLGSAPEGEVYVFAKRGHTYALYNDRSGNDLSLDLTGVEGEFSVRWFDPRKGGALQEGSVKMVRGGGPVALGDAPSDVDLDWAVLVMHF